MSRRVGLRSWETSSIDASADYRQCYYAQTPSDRNWQRRSTSALSAEKVAENRSNLVPSSQCWKAGSPAHPYLLPQNSIVPHHFDDGRSIWQPRQFFGRPFLKLPAVIHDRRTRCHAASFKTCRRAAGQPTRRDYEDGEPPPPASFSELHWFSPWSRGVPPSDQRARQSGAGLARTEGSQKL